MMSVKSQCGQCGVGCGVRAFVGDDRHVRIEGDPLHPANSGLLCPRANRLGAMASLDGRLLHPLVEGKRQGWDRTIAQIARRLSTVLARHGPGSVALHVGGALLTEDYYVANKLFKGFLGSAHIHAPSRGGIDALQAAAFGEDVMPATYEDIDRADMILLTGADIAQAYPILMDRVVAAREDHGAQVILIAETGQGLEIEADMRLTVAPGGAAALMAGLLLHCHDSGVIDPDDLARRVMVPDGFWDTLRSGRDIWSVGRASGLSPITTRAFYEAVAASSRTVTLFGEDMTLAATVQNFHLATGRIGRPGAAPFAMTATANGMGAREVGCTPKALVVHQEFGTVARASTARFWGARLLADGPGLDGDALLQAMHDGSVKALWSIGSDPVSAPWLRAASKAVPLIIRATDSVAEAGDGWTFLLPSAVWVEKDGTLTGMDRLISRQRRLFSLPGEARPDWWMVTKVAQAMGWGDAFHYERAADIYREHVRLTAYGNDGARLLNLRRHAPISNPAYDELTPWRWGEVPFDGGYFPTEDGRARLLSIPPSARGSNTLKMRQ
ncbi:molybdopterin-dependent oxidoreductase [Sphingobium sp.]|uniref:molybdopterin-dependent oxidoreductase n=1 Tax=Sphingobium sp. TaxID=1912891 RepID=UPI003BB80431